MLRQEISPIAPPPDPDPTAFGLTEEPMVLMWPMDALTAEKEHVSLSLAA